MKKTILSLLIFTFLITTVDAQKYFTREGKISFFSDAPLEKIEAENSSATSVIDLETGRVEFAVLIKAFHFEKAMMQEHFNENYMESSKFPKATFKGQVADINKIDFFADGEHEVKVNGKLTVHGVSNDVDTGGKIVIKDGQISAFSNFVVLVADYGIVIPKVVRENIAKEVSIDVALDYREFKRG